MITNFWNWLTTAVTNATSVLSTMYSNSTMRPFFDLLLIVAGIGVVIKFILAPLLGIGIGFIGNAAGSSDRAQNKKEDK